MSFLDKLLGRPLASASSQRENLSILTGVPALGLDALASTAYGPEAALIVLLPLGFVGLHYFFGIILLIVAVLFTLYLSYFQTAAAYPNGGGAYIVACENLGKRAGLWAAVALLIDYLLNVAVGISAGVGAIVSALPMLHPYILELCLTCLFMLMLINLRGIRASGLVFIAPTIIFIVCIFISIGIGLVNTVNTIGYPTPVITPPAPDFVEIQSISLWLLLGAFANGLTAMTGVEAVSNAVPLFRKPTIRNAQWTLTIIVVVLALFLLGLGIVVPSFHITAMDETKPGYKTILSQLVAAVTGDGIFYYTSIVSIFIVLTYSAQTSFSAFPRVCRYLAEDNLMPRFFADKGQRLVYSHGIILLTLLSAILLIAFKGITNALIPLFAVGAFTAFLFSQIGMVVYWLRKKKQKHYLKLFLNTIGAITTFIALIVIVLAKFMEGAWVVIVLAPLLVFLFTKIKRHYKKIMRAIGEPLELKANKLKHPIVIIPIHNLDRVAEKAIQFGLLISEDVTALNISTEKDNNDHVLRKLWHKMVENPAKGKLAIIPKLEIVFSPYRKVYSPILHFIKQTRKQNPDRLIAVIIPELIEPHWYEHLLHNIHAAGLKALIFLKRDPKTVIITVPWYFVRKGETLLK